MGTRENWQGNDLMWGLCRLNKVGSLEQQSDYYTFWRFHALSRHLLGLGFKNKRAWHGGALLVILSYVASGRPAWATLIRKGYRRENDDPRAFYNL